MWNQILDQSRSVQKFSNASILVLGNRHTGKRTLIDGLCEVSKTVISKKNQETRIRDKSLVSAIDYAYVNATNLNDPDNKMSSKLEFYLIDDDYAKTVTELLMHNPNILEKLIVIIALDSSQPWTFMIELDKWINFINQLLAKAGLPISKLDEMKARVEKYFSNYKQPVFDEDGKLVKKLIVDQGQDLVIPVPTDILQNNIRIPLIVVATKADLQSSVLRQKTSQKMAFIQYHLRKFCLTYGGSLIYVSNRNHTNLDVLYEYLLHRAYGFPLRFKSETVNEESIFVPLGSDNLQLLNDSIKASPVSYSEMIPAPVVKRQVKQQVPVEDDNEFFEKYAKEATVPKQPLQEMQSLASTPSETVTTEPRPAEINVADFYKKLLEGNTNKGGKLNMSNTRVASGVNISANESAEGVLGLTKSTTLGTATSSRLKTEQKVEAPRKEVQKKQKKEEEKIEKGP